MTLWKAEHWKDMGPALKKIGKEDWTAVSTPVWKGLQIIPSKAHSLMYPSFIEPPAYQMDSLLASLSY